jgi:hypothetical protein
MSFMEDKPFTHHEDTGTSLKCGKDNGGLPNFHTYSGAILLLELDEVRGRFDRHAPIYVVGREVMD